MSDTPSDTPPKPGANGPTGAEADNAGDGGAPAGTSAGAPAQAQQQGLPPIVVTAQYVKDLSFENPRAPNSLIGLREPPQVNVNVDVGARGLGKNAYEVVLTIRAEAKTNDNTAFVAELTYGGLFTLNNVPEQMTGPVLLIECPRLLFPFARSIIADATRDGGFPPLLINPIDFASLYQRQAAQRQAAGGAPQPQGGGPAQA